MVRHSQRQETSWTPSPRPKACDHDLALDQLPTEKWFSADDGLKTINGLLDEAENHKLDARLVADLRELKSVLEKAKQNGVGWHLAVDF